MGQGTATNFSIVAPLLRPLRGLRCSVFATLGNHSGFALISSLVRKRAGKEKKRGAFRTAAQTHLRPAEPWTRREGKAVGAVPGLALAALGRKRQLYTNVRRNAGRGKGKGFGNRL